MTRPPRIILAHDWLVGLRGGERVLDRLARLYGPAPLYTLVNDGRHLTDAIDACRVVTSPLQFMPGASGAARRWYLPLMPWAVGRLHPAPCDLVISTSSAVMKSLTPPGAARHLCYCHSPARYVWEQGGDYTGGSFGRLRGAGLRLARQPFQRWDRRTAGRVTRFVANSHHTAERIRRCFGRDASVVHPPIRTRYFTPDPAVRREDWLLVVAALEPYKRTDLVIEAARRAGVALKVAGAGSQRTHLERLAAGADVEFLGRVDDDTLRGLYRRARALVFPQVEDFGMIAVEAQACGCPVIATDAGGARETVTDETGVLVETQDVEAIVDAICDLHERHFDAPTIRANAERFSEAVFDRRIQEEVEAALAV